MKRSWLPIHWGDDRTALGLFFSMIVGIAVVSPRSDAISWNDRSRLATVECLVDYHTLAIDESMFTPLTYDKIYVDGHFYSDKSPVPVLWQALVYWILQLLFGLHAQTNPGLFCYAAGVSSCGLAYVLAAAGVCRMGRSLELSPKRALFLAGIFALATLALVYVRSVNSHILLLAVTCWLMAGVIPAPPFRYRRALALGMLAGLGYTIDLGAGPVLLLGLILYLCWKTRSFKIVAVCVVGSLPFVLLHHSLNYLIGHSIRPVAAIPEYFLWEGSKFSRESLTGNWTHPDLKSCLLYGLSLLIGPRGFLSHQPVLWIVPFAGVWLLKRRGPETPLLGLAGFWCVGTWLVYTVGSNNHAGQCCSIRWFLPLLAPCFYVIGLALRYASQCWLDVLVLGLWGMVLAVECWWGGPWAFVDPRLLIWVQVGALLSWCGLIAWRLLRIKRQPVS